MAFGQVDKASVFLRSVRLRDYKCFDDAVVDFGKPQGLTFVVGPNNAGKTVFVSALHHLIAPPTIGSVAFEWSIAPIEPRRQVGSVQYLDHLLCGLGEILEPGARTLYAVLPEATPLPRGIHGERSPTGRLWVKLSQDQGEASRRSALLIQHGGGSGTVLPSITTQTVDGAEGAIRELRQRLYMLPVTRGGSKDSVDVNASIDLMPDGSNLPNVLLWLQTRDTEGWTRVKDALDDVVPNMGRMLAKVTKQAVELVAEDRHAAAHRSLKDLGYGVEQVLLVALACETQADRSLVVLDEPEVGLHPAAQRQLLRRLRSWAQERQIVVVTHSPSLLERRKNDEPIYLVSQEKGRSRTQRIDGPLSEALEALGVEVHDAFGVRQVLIVEGASDVQVLHSWFPELSVANWIAVIDAKGSTRVRTAKDAVEQTAHIRKNNVWAILDADDGPPPPPSERVLVLDRRELENFFLDQPEAVAASLHALNVEAPPVDDLLQSIRQAADDLKPETTWLRTQARLLSGFDHRALRLQRPPGSDVAPSVHAMWELIERAKANYPARLELEQIWEEEAINLASVWERDWQKLVPGAQVLDLVWQQYGCRYKKTRDGSRIASAMRERRSTWPLDLQRLSGFIYTIIGGRPTQPADSYSGDESFRKVTLHSNRT